MLLWMSDGKLFHRIIERGKKLVSVDDFFTAGTGYRFQYRCTRLHITVCKHFVQVSCARTVSLSKANDQIDQNVPGRCFPGCRACQSDIASCPNMVTQCAGHRGFVMTMMTGRFSRRGPQTTLTAPHSKFVQPQRERHRGRQLALRQKRSEELK